MFVEGALWTVRTAPPWRDLPEAFGEWNSVFRRFSRWSAKGVWLRMFPGDSDTAPAIRQVWSQASFRRLEPAAYSVEYLNSGIAFSSSLLALYTA
jgi:transposase